MLQAEPRPPQGLGTRYRTRATRLWTRAMEHLARRGSNGQGATEGPGSGMARPGECVSPVHAHGARLSHNEQVHARGQVLVLLGAECGLRDSGLPSLARPGPLVRRGEAAPQASGHLHDGMTQRVKVRAPSQSRRSRRRAGLAHEDLALGVDKKGRIGADGVRKRGVERGHIRGRGRQACGRVGVLQQPCDPRSYSPCTGLVVDGRRWHRGSKVHGPEGANALELVSGPRLALGDLNHASFRRKVVNVSEFIHSRGHVGACGRQEDVQAFVAVGRVDGLDAAQVAVLRGRRGVTAGHSLHYTEQ